MFSIAMPSIIKSLLFGVAIVILPTLHGCSVNRHGGSGVQKLDDLIAAELYEEAIVEADHLIKCSPGPDFDDIYFRKVVSHYRVGSDSFAASAEDFIFVCPDSPYLDKVRVMQEEFERQ